MPKEKVTLTLDAARLEELRGFVDRRGLTAAVDAAVAAHVTRLRHLAAVDDWLCEMDQEQGPVPTETLEWAARIFDEWESDASGEQRFGTG